VDRRLVRVAEGRASKGVDECGADARDHDRTRDEGDQPLARRHAVGGPSQPEGECRRATHRKPLGQHPDEVRDTEDDRDDRGDDRGDDQERLRV
jgi:hypothetical protein